MGTCTEQPSNWPELGWAELGWAGLGLGWAGLGRANHQRLALSDTILQSGQGWAFPFGWFTVV